MFKLCEGKWNEDIYTPNTPKEQFSCCMDVCAPEIKRCSKICSKKSRKEDYDDCMSNCDKIRRSCKNSCSKIGFVEPLEELDVPIFKNKNNLRKYIFGILFFGILFFGILLN